jgi:hypothetical protein
MPDQSPRPPVASWIQITPALAGALEQASRSIARLDQALEGHPLLAGRVEGLHQGEAKGRQEGGFLAASAGSSLRCAARLGEGSHRRRGYIGP